MNVVMTGSGRLIEVQATAEAEPFERRRVRPAAGSGRGGHRTDQGRPDRRSSPRRTSATAGARPGREQGRLRVVLATGNAGKVREFDRLLAGAFDVRPLPPGVTLPAETGPTFAENARLKARSGVRGAGRHGRPCLPTTPGLEVAALGGRPGHLLGPLRRRERDRRARTWRSCSANWTGRPIGARSSSAPVPGAAWPTVAPTRRAAARSSRWRASPRAPSPRRLGAWTGSATTRCSSRRAGTSTLAEASPEEKDRGLAPRRRGAGAAGLRSPSEEGC